MIGAPIEEDHTLGRWVVPDRWSKRDGESEPGRCSESEPWTEPGRLREQIPLYAWQWKISAVPVPGEDSRPIGIGFARIPAQRGETNTSDQALAPGLHRPGLFQMTLDANTNLAH